MDPFFIWVQINFTIQDFLHTIEYIFRAKVLESHDLGILAWWFQHSLGKITRKSYLTVITLPSSYNTRILIEID
jgi:hypothetical protein